MSKEKEAVPTDDAQELEAQGASQEAEEEFDYDKEFDAQWGTGEVAEEEPEVEPDESEVHDDDDESSEESAEEAEETGDKDDEPEATPAEPAAPESDDPYAWIDALPDEMKAHAEALKHAALSDQGRVASLRRRERDLLRDLDRMKSRSAPEQQSSGSEPGTPAAPELPEKFKQLKEDFPEFAEAVEEIRKLDRQEFEQQMTTALEPINQQQAKLRRAEFESALDAGAAEIFNTAETGVYWKDVSQSDDFLAWLEMQPRSVQTAARIPDPQEALYVLGQYEKDYQAAVAEMEASKPKPAEEAGSTPSKADEVKARRQKQKATSVTPGSKPSVSDTSGEGTDYDAEFDRQWG